MRRLLLLLSLLLPTPAAAAIMAGFGAPSCRPAIAAAERAGAIPPGLLGAIARVESGRRDPASGSVEPWPWTADVEGTGYVYETREQAMAAVQGFLARGIRSIDVGCMQVNLQQHPDAFANLAQAFDPETNVAYAARFLADLHAQTGDWNHAAAMYHSATPALGAEYERKVLSALPDEQQRAGSSARAIAVARAWSASLPGSPFGTAGGLASLHRPIGRVIPVAASPGGVSGRSLAAYRAMPVMMARVFVARR